MVAILLSISCFCLSIVCLYLLREVNDLRQKFEHIDSLVSDEVIVQIKWMTMAKNICPIDEGYDNCPFYGVIMVWPDGRMLFGCKAELLSLCPFSQSDPPF